MMENALGKVIKSYAVEELIGSGGFGAVYRARQDVVNREVAIKVIWPAFANHANFIRRFEAEARLVASLEHPHIVPLYDYWRDPNGAYIVMRLLRGGSLRERLNNTPWSVDAVGRLMSQVTAALALAHRHDVVHRDIKPANIMLDEENNAYLADFGIAQIVSAAQDSSDIFSAMGSPAYAAPEQVEGHLPSVKSDIYSLGIIAYELLTGHHPFPELVEMSMTELSDFRATSRVPPLRRHLKDLPADLDRVIQTATHLDVSERYDDALTMMREFQRTTLFDGDASSTFLTIVSSDDVIVNPYIGLRAFQESDEANFFGREALVQRLANRLRETTPYARFLAVVGPSGSGKSSVVKAGLIPALRRGALPNSEHWYYDEIVPGTHPFKEVASSLLSLASTPPANLEERLRASSQGLLDVINEVLPDDGADFVLFIDQFEEVFTQVSDEEEVAQFLQSLFTAVTDPQTRLRVVITIRADFYDRPLLQPYLSDLVRERTEVVVPLTSTELERVVLEPARRAGLTIDSALVAAIVAEVREQLGALPLLQYTLSALYDRREGVHITLQAYRDLGGVRGALARQADLLVESMDNAERESTRQLFLRLITLGEGTEDTRRRVLLSEVSSLTDRVSSTDGSAIMQRVIDKLGKSRLLTFDRDPDTRSPTVEVTHEAIIREWGKLRDWLDESRNDVRMQRSLSSLAQEWENSAHDVSYLLRGIRLNQFEQWTQITNLQLTAAENNYLTASIEEDRRRIQEEQARQEREEQLEQQAIRRLRLLVFVMGAAVLMALVLTTIAFNATFRANQEAVFAQSIALEAVARQVFTEGNGDLSVVLGLAANDIDNPPLQSQRTLADVAFAPGTRMVIGGNNPYDESDDDNLGHSAWVTGVALSPDGNYLVSTSTDATVRFWDARTGERLHVKYDHQGDIEDLTLNVTGRFALTSSLDGRVILWDVNEGRLIRVFDRAFTSVRSVIFSPDSLLAYGGLRDGRMVVWDVSTGRILHDIQAHVAAVQSLDVSPDGKYLVSGGRDGTLRLWDTATRELVREFEGHATAISRLAYRSDGSLFVSGSTDGTVYLWDPQSGERISEFLGTQGEVRDVVFSPDGMRVFAASSDNRIYIWGIESRLPIASLQGHTDTVMAIALSSDGRQAVTGSKDLSIRLWDVAVAGSLDHIRVHNLTRVSGLDYRQAGGLLYSTAADRVLSVYDVATQTEVARYEPIDDPLLSMAISPDETEALLGSLGKLFQFDIRTGQVVGQLEGHTGSVQAVIYFDQPNRALSGDEDGLIILWDLSTGQELQRFVGHEGAIQAIALLNDQTRFVAGSRDGTAILWDVATGEVQRFDGRADSVYGVAVNADSTQVVTGSRDGSVIVWDVETGDEVVRLRDSVEPVWAVAFHPIQNYVLAGALDGTVILWDVENTAARLRFGGGNSSVYQLDFSDDGSVAYSGQGDGSIVQWATFDIAGMREWTASNRYVRALSCEEREQYRVEPYCTQ